MQKREQHIIKGQVQGVGFRPFIFRLALANSLTGFVQNTAKGVLIEIQGTKEQINRFNLDFKQKLPPLAKISEHQKQEIDPHALEKQFEIIHSEQSGHKGHSVLVSPDVAICADCKNDMFTKTNRRHAYAFTNCTSCGPRYTITKSIPYDRPVTTMGCFPLCEACHIEYTDPLDRRFHAQPNACADCGPHLWLSDGEKNTSQNPPYLPQEQNILAENKQALLQTISYLNQGKIIAVKGLGGFQLACDAFNGSAVEELRKRKNRPHKAFALMVKDLESAKEIAHINSKTEELLTSPSAPIVLCPAKNSGLPENIAPDTHRIGIMLAYTPLHLLLFSPQTLEENTKLRAPKALIMTSANQSGKPICIKNRQALRDLREIADYYLFHDRDILIRVDDSVCLALNAEDTEQETLPNPIFFRRARGYVPSPVRFPDNANYLSSVFAAGTLLKNTFTFTKGNEAYQSQHIGDLDNLEVLDFFEETTKHLQKLLEVEPQKTATDLHPDFPSTHLAETFSQTHNIGLEKVQHHISHAYSVLAEQNKLSEHPYFALILDGTGLGYDKTVWGGEIFYLFAREKRHYRLASLNPIALIGADKANFEPWRIAFAYHKKAQEKGYLAEDDIFPFYNKPEYQSQLSQCELMLEKNINCPLSSGCGRLFDAISALLEICTQTSYEGQAAIRLEEYAFSGKTDTIIKIPLHCDQENKKLILQEMQEKKPTSSYQPYIEIDTVYLYAELFKLLQKNTKRADIAQIFHTSLAHALNECLTLLKKEFYLANPNSCKLIFSGGVFNNEILLRSLYRKLSPEFQILFPQNTPPGDACISLGQAFYTALQRT